MSTHEVHIDLRCNVERAPAAIESVEEDDGCQLGASSGGAYAVLALWLARRRRRVR